MSPHAIRAEKATHQMSNNILRIVDDTATMNKGVFEMQKSIFAAIARRMQKKKEPAEEEKKNAEKAAQKNMF